jgi:hypothetical protein
MRLLWNIPDLNKNMIHLTPVRMAIIKKIITNDRLIELTSRKSICLANVRPRVQTPVLPKKGKISPQKMAEMGEEVKEHLYTVGGNVDY